MEVEGLIVGLGNPGLQYENTRHNVGASILEEFVNKAQNNEQVQRIEPLSGVKFSCTLARMILRSGKTWLLCMPHTYMNLSGDCVQPLMAWYKMDIEKLFVIHDELDMEPGRIALKKGGGLAGHNGLKSIAGRMGSQDFYRLRIGISRPMDSANVSSWVLGHFSQEKETIENAKTEAINALFLIMEKGPRLAINQINMRKAK